MKKLFLAAALFLAGCNGVTPTPAIWRVTQEVPVTVEVLVTQTGPYHFVDSWGRVCTQLDGLDCDFLVLPLPVTQTPTPGMVTSTPSATPTHTPAPPAFVLGNSGFETAGFWSPYHLTGAPVQSNYESLSSGADGRAVLEGDRSWRFLIEGVSGVWHSGIFQRVRVGENRFLTFGANGYFKAGHQSGLEENEIQKIISALRVGIDPYGGQSPTSPTVVWNQVSGDKQWKEAVVQATSAGEYVSVFIECRIGDSWSYPWSMCFLDKTWLR